MTEYQHIVAPKQGEAISVKDGKLSVPDHPIILFIEGDGIGVDITPPMRSIVDAAIKTAYDGKRRIEWTEIYAGEKAVKLYGDDQWLPEETLEAVRRYSVCIKGPLTTPVGGGMRSLNVATRQQLDLYACIRPVRYFEGVISPLKQPELTSMTIFRENTEDIYAGIEWPAESDEVRKVIGFLQNEMGVDHIRFPETSGIGIKPVSREGSQRLICRAIDYAIDNDANSVCLVHKGNIMKFTEGAFSQWGYDIAHSKYGAEPIDGGPWHAFNSPKTGKQIVVKDAIADNFLQQILIHPTEFDVIATLNLNGDYISDALAAQVGGIGIAPGANVSDSVAVFEATHGTAPKHAGFNRANPGSLVLSAEMMLRYIGWREAADLIISGIAQTLASGRMTYDLARGQEDKVELMSSSAFGEAVVQAIKAT